MTIAVAIRTHRWDADAQRLHGLLAPVLGDALCTVFHNRPADVQPPCPVIDINDGWLRANGLRVQPDWGWRCGDYFLYALRKARPDADFYWLIEPDVHFTMSPSVFFDRMAALTQDFLGVQITPMDPKHRFSKGLPGMPLWRAIFALTRFSARAVDVLFPLRQAYGQGDVPARFFTNDETFCVSHLTAAKGMTLASMAEIAPDLFPKGGFDTDPDRLIDSFANHDAAGVFHPVRHRDSFIDAVAARVTANMGFLGAMQPSLDLLTDADVAAISSEIARRSEVALRKARRS